MEENPDAHTMMMTLEQEPRELVHGNMANFSTVSTSSLDPINHDPSSLVMPNIHSDYHPTEEDCESDDLSNNEVLLLTIIPLKKQ